MNKMSLIVAFSVLSVFLSLSSTALAQGSSAPCIPNAFYGSVTVNGVPAPDGLEVSAEINGVVMEKSITYNGKYGYNPYVFYVPDNDNNCENSATVKFYIEGKPAGESQFENGAFTRLDLSAEGVEYCGDSVCIGEETCSTCSQDCGSCPSGGGGSSGGSGGGSGGGGFSGGGYVPQQQAECVPEWQCSPWSQCIDGSQSRTCTDTNSCNTTEGKPSETQECGLEAALPDECAEGTSVCVGNAVYTCSGENKWTFTEKCSGECSEGECINQTSESGTVGGTGSPSSSGAEGIPIIGRFLGNNSYPYYYLLAVAIIVIVLAFALRRKKGK